MSANTSAPSAHPEDLIEAFYEALFGRPADLAGLAIHADTLQRHGVAATLRSFVNSAEFAEKFSLPSRPRIALVGNCVSTALARCLRTSSRILTRWLADVNLVGTPAFRIAVDALLSGDADLIVTQRFGQAYPSVETDMLRRTSPSRLCTVTTIFFTGNHPDITYLGGFDTRFHSPLSDYHSRIVVSSYLEGYGVADCVARFNQDTYRSFGFFEEFDRSAAELRRRDTANDIQFADRLIDMTRHVPTLLTINHPTGAAIAELAAAVSEFCGVPSRFAATGFTNDLLDQPIWPIYPEVAEANRLPYGTAFTFRAGQSQPELSLRDFIVGSYAAYDLYDRTQLRQALAKAELGRAGTGIGGPGQASAGP